MCVWMVCGWCGGVDRERKEEKKREVKKLGLPFIRRGRLALLHPPLFPQLHMLCSLEGCGLDGMTNGKWLKAQSIRII